MMMIYGIDIDGILTKDSELKTFTDKEFLSQIPWVEVINKVNDLYDKGNIIIIITSRLWKDFEVTVKWLKNHGVKYDTLVMGKPLVDCYLDDKNILVEEFLK